MFVKYLYATATLRDFLLFSVTLFQPTFIIEQYHFCTKTFATATFKNLFKNDNTEKAFGTFDDEISFLPMHNWQ